jgi:hypothetical protein
MTTPEKDAVNREITNLVIQYREGNTNAAEKLLQRFAPLLHKYRNVLWYGKFSSLDPEMYRFLGFFHKDRKTAAELLSISLRKGEIEDLEQILSYSLLKTALKYNKISAGFKFILKEEIAYITRDSLAHRTTINWDFSIKSHSNKNSYSKYESTVNSFLIEGSTREGLSELTKLERLIAVKAFIEGLPNTMIASQMKLTLRQVRRYRQKVRDKLNKVYKQS